jgi:hypothetical protein
MLKNLPKNHLPLQIPSPQRPQGTVNIVALIALIIFCWILNYVIEKVENLNLVGAMTIKKNGNRRMIALSGMKTGSVKLTLTRIDN